VFLSAKTAGNGITPLLLVKFKDQNALSIVVHTRVSTTNISYDIAKQISKSTYLYLKQNKRNYVLTHLNTLTAKAIIKLTPICAFSRSINLIKKWHLKKY